MKNNLCDLNNHLFSMLEELNDGNHRNCDISNLFCLSRAENSVMNNKRLRFDDAELTETGLLIDRVMIKTCEREKE